MSRIALRAGVIVLGGVLLVACAQAPGGPERGQGGSEAGWLLQPASQAVDAVALGDTRTQVRERLGQAAEARFASGREVWVYRFGERQQTRRSDPAHAQELVILFGTTGRVERWRLRHADGSE